IRQSVIRLKSSLLMQDVLERPVTSYMHRLFVILDENMSVASAVKEMHSHNASLIMVLRGNTPVGIVTDSDIINKVVMKGEDSDEVFLKSIMSNPLITISPKGTVKQALHLMRLHEIKRIPVADASGILGVVTQESLANAVRTSVIERTFSRYRSFFCRVLFDKYRRKRPHESQTGVNLYSERFCTSESFWLDTLYLNQSFWK